MKTDDVEIGATYICYVGNILRRVVVTERIQGPMLHTGRRGITRFRVRREDQTTSLPKTRCATALRPVVRTTTLAAMTLNSAYGKTVPAESTDSTEWQPEGQHSTESTSDSWGPPALEGGSNNSRDTDPSELNAAPTERNVPQGEPQ